MSGEPFQPLRAGRLFQDAVDQIAYAIRSGRYQVGDRLPGIDELAQLMNTSRPTIREAVGLLAHEGVLRVRRGHTGGIEVASSVIPSSVLAMSRTGRAATLAELVEARRPIELALANLAARRATPENFAAMQAAVDALPGARGDRAQWVRVNDLFHYEMARAARSPRLARYAHEVMQELAVLLDGFDEKFTDYEHTVRVHQETLEALRDGDPARIASIMDDHLSELEKVTWPA